MKNKLKEILYKDGKPVPLRFSESYFNKNGYQDIVTEVFKTASDLFGEHSFPFPDLIKMILHDAMLIPECHVCKNTHLKWNKQKKQWSKYCSMKCCQNDPEVKSKMLKGQEGVDWNTVIASRENTMLETYGVIAASQLQENKEKIAEASRKYYSDQENVVNANNKREITNKERYGVPHLSMDMGYHKKRMLVSSETKQNKSADERINSIDKYRNTRMGVRFDKLNSYDWFYDQYVTNRKRLYEISYELNTHYDTVLYAMGRHGIGIDLDREQTKNRSVKEIELFDFVSSMVVAENNYKINGREADIFIPSKNIAIEFNGVYWHSELKKKNNAHKKKMDHFLENGVRLVQIWEDDWDSNKACVKKFLTNMLTTTYRIGANKTRIEIIDQPRFNKFLNEHHLLGERNCSIRIALIFEDTIKSVMGINNHRDGKYSIERFSNDNITGAFGKMLKWFDKNYAPKEVVTYADLEIVSPVSNVYLSNGFVEDERQEPTYRYYNRKTKRREDKRNWKIESLAPLLDDIENISEYTEREMAAELLLTRCYDSGKIRYIKRYI